MIAPPVEGAPLGCGHPCPHQYTPGPGVILADRGTWRCTCGKLYGAGHGIGTGYARDRDGRTLCYPCAEDAEARDFAAAQHWTAYADKGAITTWTGRELARIVSERIRYDHPSGHPVTHVRAVAPDGSRWWGRYLADWTQAVTLHRNKGGTRA
jgi:hypothetical protein